MILESVRIVADWLQHATYGVNALRASVPQDTSVTAPPAVTVLDSTRNAAVARGQVPVGITLPALLVTPADQPLEQTAPAARPWPADATVTVLVRYATSLLDTAQGERDASQTVRAVWRSIGQLMVTSTGESARTRAQVQLIGVSDMRAATLYEANEDTAITAGVLLTCRVRDLWATS